MRYEKKYIGNKLKASRKLLGCKQTQVAKSIGLKSAARLAKWEQGKSFPSVPNLLKLSALYSVLANDLYLDLYLKYKDDLRKHNPIITFKKEEEND
jgi:transcriptional regulator with XRE-family HTH domain